MCDECTDDRKGKPLVGLEIIRGAKKAEGKDVWEDGKILDPENGKNYTLRLTPIDGGKKLEVRGSACSASAARRPGSASSNDTQHCGNSMSRFQVKKVAVLGAGVMGAQIAAHLVNVRVPVVLFDLPAKEGPKNGIVARAIDNLKKLKPSPLATWPRTPS